MGKKQKQISAHRIKALAYEHELMILASEAVGLDLAELLERKPDLAEAWERGQLLRRLYRLGKETFAPSHAANALGISQDEFAKLLKEDREVRQLWEEARLLQDIEIRRSVLKSVETGKLSVHKTMKLLNGCFNLRQASTDPPDDIHHVRPGTLAKLFGVSRETLNFWRRERGLQRNPDDLTFNLKVALPWYKRWIENGRKLAGGTMLAGSDKEIK